MSSQSIATKKNHNSAIIWSTTHPDQLSYHIWKLSNKLPHRSCIHKEKLSDRTKERTEKL